MKELEYHYVDKSDWDRGPWDDEPDKRQWKDEATGLPCLIVRGPMGALCGYVGVAEGHPLFKKEYNSGYEVEHDLRLPVHGGLTFSGMCRPGEDEHGICHIPEPGEPDHVWWFGFDCAHSQDLTPAMNAHYRRLEATADTEEQIDLVRRLTRISDISGRYRESTYKTIQYVKDQCALLAAQLAA